MKWVVRAVPGVEVGLARFGFFAVFVPCAPVSASSEAKNTWEPSAETLTKADSGRSERFLVSPAPAHRLHRCRRRRARRGSGVAGVGAKGRVHEEDPLAVRGDAGVGARCRGDGRLPTGLAGWRR